MAKTPTGRIRRHFKRAKKHLERGVDLLNLQQENSEAARRGTKAVVAIEQQLKTWEQQNA